MTLEEYIETRNLMVDDPQYRHNIYRHVGYRLFSRFGITHPVYNLDQWIRLSYQCATRGFTVLLKDKKALFFSAIFDGHEVVWVYCRMRKCIVTVLRPEDKQFKAHYLATLPR